MLVPGIARESEIVEKFKQLYYTDDMMYEGCRLGNYIPSISDAPDNIFIYAIVDKDQVIGYFSYTIDWYSRCAYDFDLLSFDKGNPIIGIDIMRELKKLLNVYHLHRIVWRMVGGNHVEKNYDRFCARYGGTKHVLKDVFMDKYGNYRDSVIYEILQT